MEHTPLHALSPLDGRYAHLTHPLGLIFSEASLISYRIEIELWYLQALSEAKVIRAFTKSEKVILTELQEPNQENVQRVKAIEKTTHHDVKAVEYYLAEQFQTSTLRDCVPFIHIGLTSEDVNNLAYRLMLTRANQEVLLPLFDSLLIILADLSQQNADLPMLARTHGQPAIPTTVGKEISVFGMRLLAQVKQLDSFQLTGKLNGAVGSYQALHSIQPQIDWIAFTDTFVSSLGLLPNLHTTQINPADDLIELFHVYHRINSILIDLNQDMWRYISDDWLIQSGKDKTVGSSTMPQKVNPIEFENSEGNLTMANGLIETVNRKLPISRLQRDLSDSTINRNLGSILGYCFVGYSSLHRGLQSIKPNAAQIEQDLNQNYAILGEALQTHLRYQQKPQAYEQVAALVKHHTLSQVDWQKTVTPIDPQVAGLTPQTYIGLASQLTHQAVTDIQTFLARKAP